MIFNVHWVLNMIWACFYILHLKTLGSLNWAGSGTRIKSDGRLNHFAREKFLA
jgi:hypothetical protein